VAADRWIPVAEPALVGREGEYVEDCLTTTWISSAGSYIKRFEESFADFVGVEHAIACCNGTAALHLALLALGVGPGDEVIVPTLTYVASANAVRYCGATPVFVDSEPKTWNLDPGALAPAITERTKGIMGVHLYGHPADMDAVNSTAEKHDLWVLEDAAEAHGARYRGRIAGSLSDCAVFSFYGNKIVTTGEGGMIVTRDAEMAHRLRLLRGQGQDPERRYWFPIVGYNYRLTNVAAAIGLAQMERVDWHVERRREVASWYRDRLNDSGLVDFSPAADWAEPAYWMSSVLLREGGEAARDHVMEELAVRGIETRPFFYPLHMLPPYAAENIEYPVATSIASRGINLPSSASLTADDIDYVCGALESVVPQVVQSV
jgi:perosamine synthetase